MMGTRFEITAVASSQPIAKEAVMAGISEIERIESMISSWQSDSETSMINENAGNQAVKVSDELFQLIKRSIKVSEITNGAFDISFASIGKLYVFDGEEHELPAENDRRLSVEKIDFKKIILNEESQTVLLKESGMQIGFGGIGKGYAANRAKEVMNAIPGVVGGVVNAAGDLMIWGTNGKTNSWPIQISDPKDIEKSIAWLEVNDASVVTSGDYEKYFTYNGSRYAHIVDPLTGLPTTGIKSATVICPDAELGDALATAMFVMGPDDAIDFINRVKNVEALIITDEDELIYSKNLKLNYY
jgi:thiamine biosynthesis lipoprotein